MKWQTNNKALSCQIYAMTSREAAEMRLAALGNKAFLKWQKGGTDALLTFKKARDLEMFIAALPEIASLYK